MEHESAVRSHAAERYVSGEFNAQEREQFEEHFFACPECAEDVRTATMFAANARAVFQDQKVRKRAFLPGFFSSPWATPFLAGANLVLLVAIGYTLLGVLPRFKREIAQAQAPQYVQEVVVLGVPRGQGYERTISPATQRIVLSFSFPEGFERVSYQIKDSSGAVKLADTVPPPPSEASAESLLSVSTAGLAPGEYEVTLTAEKTGAAPSLIGQRRFTIRAEARR